MKIAPDILCSNAFTPYAGSGLISGQKVVPKLKSTPDWIGDPDRRTLGLRCPSHPVALEFLRASGPLAVTSANISGRPAVLTVDDAKNLFGDDVAVYLDGEAVGGSASTIIDLTQPAEWVLRDGPIVP